ncbi:DUF6414 family protein [Flavonifractor hominis]|uniref:Uncharacterized protein n=1 Tax=Flavonifractor hominis TaxID=3133178 RepID=A0ABV1ES44_9FIRM
MKRFLYYNQDSVNSLLAQIEQGLLIKKDSGKEETTSLSSTAEMRSDITGDLSAKVLGIGASVQGDIQASDADTEITTKMIRNIQEKALHDYAFEKVYEYIIGNDMIKNEDPKIGDYILINEVPTFLDFNYFQALFAENGAVKLANDQSKKQIDDLLTELRQSVPKGTQIPAPIKAQIKELENKIKSAEPERKEMAKTIEAIRNTLPYNRFVMTDNMLIPLDDENFRDDPNIVAFKYGGCISALGYVTNIVIESESVTPDNDFAPLYDAINKIMLSMFHNKKKIYIVHPIALYY